MFAGYKSASGRGTYRGAGAPRRYVKRRNPGTFRGRAVGPRARGVTVAQMRNQIPRGFITARAADAKFLDTAKAVYACNTTGSIVHLSPVPQGTTVVTREGKSFVCRKLQVRGIFQADVTTTTAFVAAYIVWDKQPNKALAAVTDIFNTVDAYSFTKRENNGRFVILKKWIYAMAGNITTPATGKEFIRCEKYMNLPAGLVVECTQADTTGVITNTINGALLLVTMGDVVAGTADANFIAGFRLGFSDK